MNPTERPRGLEADQNEHPEVLSLDSYQEIRGRLAQLESDDQFIYIELSSGTLRFECDSPEAEICGKQLKGNEGTFVSILRTDDPMNRIHVMIDESAAKGADPASRLGKKRKSLP
jgi:hypothetical protein